MSALLAGCLLVTSARAATAQPQGGQADREAQRAAIYKSAADAASQGRWAEAKELLRAALAIRPSPKIYFSLAQAEEHTGQLASAQADYARSIEGAATAGDAEVVRAAADAQRALALQVPHLTVTVSGIEGSLAARGPSSTSRATATLDGQPIAIGTPVAADSGEHKLSVSAPGMKTFLASVTVAEGQRVEVPVRLEADAPVPVAPPPPTRDVVPPTTAPPRTETLVPSSSGLSSWKIGAAVAVGAGVVALGIGVGFGAESIAKHGDAQKACPGATCPTESGSTMWHDAVSAGNVSTAAIAVGAIAVAGGVVLWLIAPKGSRPAAQVGVGPKSLVLAGTF